MESNNRKPCQYRLTPESRRLIDRLSARLGQAAGVRVCKTAVVELALRTLAEKVFDEGRG